MTQDERLALLTRAFRDDAEEYRGLSVPESAEEQRRLLRTLMNVRPPRPMDAETLALQDAYLHQRAEERGIVSPRELPSIAESLRSLRPFADRLILWQGDITCLAADAIVNAANAGMLGCFVPCHSCIDNCIHSFAGVQLRMECDRQMEEKRRRFGSGYQQPTAEPMLTDAYNLPAGKVVHIVGPIVEDRLTHELEAQLAACYRRTLDLCAKNDLRSVAFCCISTGVFRFPARRACEIAVQTVTDWLTQHPDAVDRVIFTVHSDRSRQIYEENLS